VSGSDDVVVAVQVKALTKFDVSIGIQLQYLRIPSAVVDLSIADFSPGGDPSWNRGKASPMSIKSRLLKASIGN
jgi:hypothetical protein